MGFIPFWQAKDGRIMHSLDAFPLEKHVCSMSETSLPPNVQPVAKKKSPWLFIGLGCLGLVLVAIVGTVVLVGWGANKVAQVAKDAGMNPEQFAAELIVKANPDLELVRSVPNEKTITIRQKSTGEEITLSFADIAAGKFSIKQKGKEISIDSQSQAGGGVITVTEDDKTTQITTSTAATKLPAWLPSTPSLRFAEGGYQITENGVASGLATATSSESVATLHAFYKAELEKEGFAVEENKIDVGEVEVATLQATHGNDGRNLTLTIQKSKDASEAQLSFIYKDKEAPKP